MRDLTDVPTTTAAERDTPARQWTRTVPSRRPRSMNAFVAANTLSTSWSVRSASGTWSHTTPAFPSATTHAGSSWRDSTRLSTKNLRTQERRKERAALSKGGGTRSAGCACVPPRRTVWSRSRRRGQRRVRRCRRAGGPGERRRRRRWRRCRCVLRLRLRLRGRRRLRRVRRREPAERRGGPSWHRCFLHRAAACSVGADSSAEARALRHWQEERGRALVKAGESAFECRGEGRREGRREGGREGGRERERGQEREGRREGGPAMSCGAQQQRACGGKTRSDVDVVVGDGALHSGAAAVCACVDAHACVGVRRRLRRAVHRQDRAVDDRWSMARRIRRGHVVHGPGARDPRTRTYVHGSARGGEGQGEGRGEGRRGRAGVGGVGWEARSMRACVSEPQSPSHAGALGPTLAFTRRAPQAQVSRESPSRSRRSFTLSVRVVGGPSQCRWWC